MHIYIYRYIYIYIYIYILEPRYAACVTSQEIEPNYGSNNTLRVNKIKLPIDELIPWSKWWCSTYLVDKDWPAMTTTIFYCRFITKAKLYLRLSWILDYRVYSEYRRTRTSRRKHLKSMVIPCIDSFFLRPSRRFFSSSGLPKCLYAFMSRIERWDSITSRPSLRWEETLPMQDVSSEKHFQHNLILCTFIIFFFLLYLKIR